jgi:hypothetical protein
MVNLHGMLPLIMIHAETLAGDYIKAKQNKNVSFEPRSRGQAGR